MWRTLKGPPMPMVELRRNKLPRRRGAKGARWTGASSTRLALAARVRLAAASSAAAAALVRVIGLGGSGVVDWMPNTAAAKGFVERMLGGLPTEVWRLARLPRLPMLPRALPELNRRALGGLSRGGGVGVACRPISHISHTVKASWLRKLHCMHTQPARGDVGKAGSRLTGSAAGGTGDGADTGLAAGRAAAADGWGDCGDWRSALGDTGDQAWAAGLGERAGSADARVVPDGMCTRWRKSLGSPMSFFLILRLSSVKYY